MISSFEGEHAFLSNFWIEPFDCAGRIVPTAEHAYQAQKAPRGDKAVKDLILSACDKDGNPNPGHAKRLGKRVKLREDWEDVKVPIMRQIIACKFAHGSALAEKLIATDGHHLVEGNTWGDEFWGCVKVNTIWQGANHLGIILMERRKVLIEGGEA